MPRVLDPIVGPIGFGLMVEPIAKEKGCTPAQLAISWVASQSNRPGQPTIILIPGATAVARLEENSKPIKLSEEELKMIDDIVEAFKEAGARQPDYVPTNT